MADPRTPGDAVLEALHRLQAELATAAMDGPGLAVVLPNAAFDALAIMMRRQETNSSRWRPLEPTPVEPAETFAILTLSGYMTIRRAEPYQPLRFGPWEQITTPKTDFERQHLLDQVNAAARKLYGPSAQGVASSLTAEMQCAAFDRSWSTLEAIPPKPAVKRLESPNHNLRGQPIDVILLHHTGSNSTHGALLHLCDPAPGNNPKAAVSAHYVVSPEGLVWQLVDDERRAWHAGECELRGEKCDMNGRSIGIELVNAGDGKTPFTDAQYAITRQLVAHLQARHSVPWENVLGHKDVAVPKGRKGDPADNFRWIEILPPQEWTRRAPSLSTQI